MFLSDYYKKLDFPKVATDGFHLPLLELPFKRNGSGKISRKRHERRIGTLTLKAKRFPWLPFL